MPATSTLALFTLAALGLLIIPGPSVMYIVTRSVDQGRRAGLVSVMGISVGTLVHTTAAALGLSALLVSSALAFDIVKYAGAAYLIYIGIRTLRAPAEALRIEAAAPSPLSRVFYQGILVNTLNPKTALFFLAFMPQFVDPARGSVTIQVLVLGCMMVLIGICSDGTYALIAGTAAEWIKTSTRFANGKRYFSGCIYIGLGIAAACAGVERK